MAVTSPFLDAIEKLDFSLLKNHISKFAASKLGAERMLAVEPSVVYAEIRDELALVKEMRSLLDADDPPPLDSLDDCRAALHRASIEASILLAEDFRQILQALVTFRQLSVFFSKRTDRCPLLSGLAHQLVNNKMLEYHIDRIVDEEGNVKDSASKELRQIRREIIEHTNALRRRMEAILKKASDERFVQEELVTLRDGRMVLPVRTEFKRQVPGFIHSASATGHTVYIEPTETLDLNNEIRDLQFSEQREISRILHELTDRLRPSVIQILQSFLIYSEIDSLFARARYAQSVFGNTPKVISNRDLNIIQGRHPILLMHKRFSDVVPLDIQLMNPISTIIITGPNAGGKSVAMKTVGLLALMIQSGIPVPCDERSEFPVYSNIFVDIGDEQSVENDLSTFSSHVQRLGNIVEYADKKSLVLIDEIGTGTDPAEGSALGAAILEELTSRKSHIIATTHHGMLKAYAHAHPNMQNAAMEFDVTTLQPTYRFHAGLPGSSYAFEITRRHGMHTKIIDHARNILGTHSDALEHLLAEVEKRSQELGNQLRFSEQLQRKYDRLIEEYKEKLANLKRETKQIKHDAYKEANKILSDANAVIENAVREIREKQAARDAIKQAKERLDKFHQEVEKGIQLTGREPEKLIESTAKVTEGDVVAMRSNPSTKGIVLEEAGADHVLVAFGSVKMRVEVSSLIILEKQIPAEHVSAYTPSTPVKSEIDVRGMYGDEAIKTIDAYLYDAHVIGLKRVDIIHGKGTGALRRRVHEYLRDLPIVESFRLGEWNEGMTGVTVVFLKG